MIGMLFTLSKVRGKGAGKEGKGDRGEKEKKRVNVEGLRRIRTAYRPFS